MGFPGRQGAPQSRAILLWESFCFWSVSAAAGGPGRLTVIILKQYLATESMTVLVEAVLNSDTRLLLTDEQGLSEGFLTGPQSWACPRARDQGYRAA